MGQGVGGWRLEVGGGRWEEVAEGADSIHINSLILFFFIFHFHFYVSYFIFQKYIRYEQCEFPQEYV
jgi:hypothetical protein